VGLGGAVSLATLRLLRRADRVLRAGRRHFSALDKLTAQALRLGNGGGDVV